ncbi:hypothetical protein AK812_SmicGene38724 [Symbiodinium microadriaticum]|uniref:Uncharacterized protein n=1 Tax=Symbiodinium microadriaticum TaxID=2951 RepID=A0A1Q9CD05_SYMMI|nr:hypothetical protein AK812_SmicGene38724 [Symbiodinium microadriaticum]CAE7037901.1 unnamed protein product [Symbiodinium sp. KB8]CAE7213879.1 unnamed protein product [Symbiodinium microadriaticum]
MALRAYGNWLYKTGGTLHELRHAILAAQRQYLHLKPLSSIVWELVSRWEHLEPPAHRVPIPEPISQAIVALAWCTGFRAFAGVTLLAFYGLGRIGEVLATTRADLLLPGADLWDQGDDVFLRLGSSKTSTRGRGRVQHLKITDRAAIRLIVAAFQDVDPERLKHQSTLEYYLQEVGAITALNALGDTATRKIKAAAATYAAVSVAAVNQ